jgi:hypothetical protein
MVHLERNSPHLEFETDSMSASARQEAQRDFRLPACFLFPTVIDVVTTTRRSPQGKRSKNMDDVRSQMESVTRSYLELDRKISENGGAQNLFGMSRKIRQSLESITLGELDGLLSEIHRAKEGLTRLQEDVVELRVLKEVLSSTPLQPLNGGVRS